MLTVEFLREILSYDPNTGIFIWKKTLSNRNKVGNVAGTISDRGYIVITINKKRLMAHRLAWMHYFGSEPNGVIDHLDGVHANNRISNLRDVEQVLNTRNNRLSKNNSSGYPGVYLNKRSGKWGVQIWNGMKRKCLGSYESKEKAIQVRKQAEMELGYKLRIMS